MDATAEVDDLRSRLEALEESAKFAARLRYEQAAVVANLKKPFEESQSNQASFHAFAQAPVQESLLSEEHQRQFAYLVNRMTPESSVWISYWKDTLLVVVVHNGTAEDLRTATQLVEHSICAQARVSVWSGDKVNTMNAFLNAAFRNEDAQASCTIAENMVFYSNCPWTPCVFREPSRHLLHEHRGRMHMRPFGDKKFVTDMSPPLFVNYWYDFRTFMEVVFLGSVE